VIKILNEIALHKPQSAQSKDPDSQIGSRAAPDQTPHHYSARTAKIRRGYYGRP